MAAVVQLLASGTRSTHFYVETEVQPEGRSQAGRVTVVAIISDNSNKGSSGTQARAYGDCSGTPG